MMTRGQVARRLGKSLATVRRMEGVQLHPWLDEHGIHRFGRAEVETVARGESFRGPTLALELTRERRPNALAAATPSATTALRDGPHNWADATALEARIATLEGQLLERTRELAEAHAALERVRRDLEDANLATQSMLTRELRDALVNLPRRQLRRLLQADPELIEDLLA
jgi:hypothetical protein